MTYSSLRPVLLCSLIVLCSLLAVGQVSTGTPPFGSFGGGPDVINLGNLNVQYTVPIINKPGRGIPFFYNLSYDSSIWSPVVVNGVSTWQPIANWGWKPQTSAAVGYYSVNERTQQCAEPTGGGANGYYYVAYTQFEYISYVDNVGTSHPMYAFVADHDTPCNPNDVQSASTSATDGSGYSANILVGQPTVYTRDNTAIQVPINTNLANGNTRTDRNGNEITANSGSFIDTLGLTALSINGSGTSTDPMIYTFQNTSGSATPSQVTVYYLSYPVQTAFTACSVHPFSGQENLVDRIVYPDGSKYSFQYEQTPGFPKGTVTGRISQVTLPTGGTIYYSYSGGDGGGIFCADGSTAGFSRQTSDGTTTYSRSGTGTSWNTTVADAPTGGNQTLISFQTAGRSGSPQDFYETQRKSYQGTIASGTLLARSDRCYDTASYTTTSDCTGTAITLPINKIKSYATLGTVTNLTDITYNTLGLPTETDEYDWGTSPAYGSLQRKTTTQYYGGGFPALVTVQDGHGTQSAQTTYNYDQTTPTPTSNVPQHVAVTGTRANLTNISQWLNTINNTVNTVFSFDDTGNVLSRTDPWWSDGVTHSVTNYSYGCSNAYLTQVNMPDTNSPGLAHHVVSSVYNCDTGLVTKFTDQNGNPTTYTYDSMLRPLTVAYPDGGQTSFSYTAGSPTASAIVQSTITQDSTHSINQYVYLDGYGRTMQTRQVDPEGDDTSETTYDNHGRVASVTNPHRSTAAVTDGTTQYQYDALDRVTTITEQDNATLQYSYSSNNIISSDELGHQYQKVVDGLGRLTQAIEPNPSTGSLSSGQFTSMYGYDILGNVVSVNQVGDGSQAARNRTFVYDSLSRLTSATVPESGQTTYQYDNPGHLTAITDARGVKTTISYDLLNRPISKTYSDTTPAVTLNYDEASPWGVTSSNNNTIGRLSSQSTNPNQSGAMFIYDSRGRLIRNDQCGKSNCGSGTYGVSGTYDYTGELTSLIYPSGRKVVNSFSPAARLLKVNYDSYSGTSINYPYYTVPQSSSSTASSWGYWPAGALQQFSFGSGVSGTFNINNRLQLNQISASTSAQTLFSKTYGFATPNNGSILRITDNLNNNRTQTFSYDTLNRLTSAATVATSGSDAWSQTYSIDPWGNMKQNGSWAFQPNFDQNNRIQQAPSNCTPMTVYCYDSAGNLLNDSFHQYAYDAEERIRAMDGSVATYIYAADGQRSRKDISGGWTEYVYFGGKAIAEKNSTGDWSDYIFANGQRVAKAEGLDRGVRIYGTNSATNEYSLFYLSNAGGLNGYTIRSGDKLYLSQYQLTGSKGGMTLGFSDGSNSNWTVKDAEGYYLNDDQMQNSTHVRTIDLSSLAGKTVNSLNFTDEADTAAGSWAIIYEQVSLVSTDGTVFPIYTGQTSSPVSSISSASGVTGAGSSIDNNRGHAIYPTLTTTYYSADHLGSARMITSGNGYPVWSGVFAPFGREVNPQITMNNYKFTDDEHDSESNLEHTWFRQLSSTEGRWLSPDFYMGSMNLTNPQSLNRYSNVLNNPLSGVDPDGLECVWDGGSYDSEDDPSTGSPAKCQAAGGTWMELGMNGNWSPIDDDVLGGLVAAIKEGLINAVSAVGLNGQHNITVYNGKGLVSFTDTNNTMRWYGYWGNENYAWELRSAPDENGAIADGLAIKIAQNPVSMNLDEQNIERLAYQIDFMTSHPLGRDPRETACTYGDILAFETGAIGPLVPEVAGVLGGNSTGWGIFRLGGGCN